MDRLPTNPIPVSVVQQYYYSKPAERCMKKHTHTKREKERKGVSVYEVRIAHDKGEDWCKGVEWNEPTNTTTSRHLSRKSWFAQLRCNPSRKREALWVFAYHEKYLASSSRPSLVLVMHKTHLTLQLYPFPCLKNLSTTWFFSRVTASNETFQISFKIHKGVPPSVDDPPLNPLDLFLSKPLPFLAMHLELPDTKTLHADLAQN